LGFFQLYLSGFHLLPAWPIMARISINKRKSWSSFFYSIISLTFVCPKDKATRARIYRPTPTHRRMHPHMLSLPFTHSLTHTSLFIHV
jgi:hypothetical protein